MKKALPDKPSELIRLALSDLKKVEASSAYGIKMSTWHEPEVTEEGTKCYVCFAGSVMAMSLEADPGKMIDPSVFVSDIRYKLLALNHFRLGDVMLGLWSMRIDSSRYKGEPYIHVCDYRQHPPLFHENMEAVAQALEDSGL